MSEALFIPRWARNIKVTPAGGISQTNVQSALEGLDGRIITGSSNRTYMVTDHGCVGDGRMNNTGSIPVGSNILTIGVTIATSGPLQPVPLTGSWRFNADDVGKAIVIYGAGAGGGQLTTTITGYVTPTQVYIGTNALSTISSDAPVAWGTDNTAAFQALINEILKYNPPDGTPNYDPAYSAIWTSPSWRESPTVVFPMSVAPWMTGKYLFTGGITFPSFTGLRITGDVEGPGSPHFFEWTHAPTLWATSITTPLFDFATNGGFDLFIDRLTIHYPCQAKMLTWITTHAPLTPYPPTIDMNKICGGAIRNLTIVNAYDFCRFTATTKLYFEDLSIGVYRYGFNFWNLFDVNYFHNIFFQINYCLIEEISFRTNDWDNTVGNTSNGRYAFNIGYADEQVMSNIFMMSGYAGIRSYPTDTGVSDGMGGTIQGGPYGEISNFHMDSVSYSFIIEATRSYQVGWKVTNMSCNKKAVWFKYNPAQMSLPFHWVGGGIYGNASPANSFQEDTNVAYELKVFGVRGLPDMQVSRNTSGIYQPATNWSQPMGISVGRLNPKQPLDINGYGKFGDTDWYGTTLTGGEVRYNSSTGKMQGYNGVAGAWQDMN